MRVSEFGFARTPLRRRLVDLILCGEKTAGAALLVDFEPEGEDRFRTVSGRERGEVLRVVRDESGAVVKLYWATYPFTRSPEIFGPQGRRS